MNQDIEADLRHIAPVVVGGECDVSGDLPDANPDADLHAVSWALVMALSLTQHKSFRMFLSLCQTSIAMRSQPLDDRVVVQSDAEELYGAISDDTSVSRPAHCTGQKLILKSVTLFSVVTKKIRI